MSDREYLGERLRAARERCGLSGQQIAASLEVNQSTISRIERGVIRPDPDLITGYLGALPLSRREKTELEFLTQSFLVEFDRWRCEETGTIAELQKWSQRWELSSTSMQIYSPQVIPGLLQTKEYMNDLFIALGERSIDLRRQAVRARTRRKSVLKKTGKKFTFIIPESTLRIRVGSNKIMHDQIHALERWVSGSNGALLKIIPEYSLSTAVPMTNFIIFNNTFVFIETTTRGVRIYDEEEVREYQKLFIHLDSLALSGDSAMQIVKGEISNLKKEIALR